ncbi:hypothetical protein Tco_0647645 [Tanacetum coccineum]
MMTLKFADTHNIVAFLFKPAESEGFEKIVDLLNAHSIKHALTVNPTIYTLCIEQFWATVKAKTVNREVQLQALVDGKKIIITESTVRRDLQLEDADGVDCLLNATIFEQLTLMSTKASAIICLATNQKFNFSKYNFESMVKNLDNVGKFLMYPRFVQTGEDMFGVNDLDGDEVIVESVDVVNTAKETRTDSTRPKAKGIVFHEQEQAPTPTVSSQQPSQVKVQDKGKGKMVEPEPVKKMSKKDLLRLDEELAFKLQAEEEEEERLAREKAQQVEEANIAWDDVQAKIEADYQLAQRLQAQEQEELTDEEKARLFVQFLEQRRKHFAAKREKEKRNRPPTKSKQKEYHNELVGIESSRRLNKSWWKKSPRRRISSFRERIFRILKRIEVTAAKVWVTAAKQNFRMINAKIKYSDPLLDFWWNASSSRGFVHLLVLWAEKVKINLSFGVTCIRHGYAVMMTRILNPSLNDRLRRKGVESSNSVKRPKSKDTKSKNRVLKNTNVKRPSTNDRKVSNSRVKRALFTSLVATKSRNLGTTIVVAKSRFSVAKTPIETNKVSSASSLSPDSSQSRTLSNYMKNKIATSRKWQK